MRANEMLMILILLIATTNGKGWFSKKIPKWDPKWTPKQKYGAFDDDYDDHPAEDAKKWKWVAELPGKAILYQLDEKGENKLMMQLIKKNRDLEALQKLLWERDYEEIVKMFKDSRFPSLTIHQVIELRNQSFFRQMKFRKDLLDRKALFWGKKSRDFSETVLRWVLSRANSTVKEEIFSFAARADLSSISEKLPSSIKKIAVDKYPGDDCVVCLEEMKNESLTTSCGHKFHANCLKQWTGGCPTCRAVISPTPFFIKAVKENSPKSVEKIMNKMDAIDMGVEVVHISDVPLDSKMNALQFIAMAGDAWGKMCEVLLNNGMQPLIETPPSTFFSPDFAVIPSMPEMTPMMIATFKSSPKIVQCLIDHGAEVKPETLNLAKGLQSKNGRRQKEVYKILSKEFNKRNRNQVKSDVQV